MEQNRTFPFDLSEDETLIGPGGQVQRTTIQEEFTRLIGRYVIGEFLIGTGGLYIQAGILARVGENVIILYDPDSGTYTSCDLFSIKFLTYFPENAPLYDLPEAEQRAAFRTAYQERLRRIRAFNAATHPGATFLDLVEEGVPGTPAAAAAAMPTTAPAPKATPTMRVLE